MNENWQDTQNLATSNNTSHDNQQSVSELLAASRNYATASMKHAETPKPHLHIQDQAQCGSSSKT
jgi:hypothetical protein